MVLECSTGSVCTKLERIEGEMGGVVRDREMGLLN